jgi:3-isopropylmalate/(R)-2-methylmalate dehydratase small subunit
VIRDDAGWEFAFTLDAYRRQLLLAGLDDIGVTLQHTDAITQFELQRA